MDSKGNKVRLIEKYLVVIYRCGAILGIVAVLYLQNHYVTKESYEADKKDFMATQQKISEVLARMEEKNSVNARQDERLGDHETRIRILENRR